MRHNNYLRLVFIPVALCASLLVAAPAYAQMDPGSGVSSPQPVPAPETKTRARRITETSEQRPTPPSETVARTESTTKQAESESNDEVRTLVEAPVASQEKIRLQLKVVEQLVAADKKQDALKELRSMVAEDLFDPQGFYNIGNAFARLGDADAAVSAYRKAIAQRKGRYSRALNNLGVVLMRQGRWDEASDSLLTALRLENFHYAEASYNLGRLYASQGQRDLAMRQWRRAVQVDPGHTAALQAIAGGGRDYEITVAVQPRAKNSTASSTADTKASDTKQIVAARPRASYSSKVLTVDALTYNDLQQARSAHERGKDQEALAKYRSVISRMGGYFGPANLELSYVLIGLKQPADALPLLQDVTARDGSRFPISYYHLARLYEFSGELELAAKAYEQVAAYFEGSNPQFLLDVSRVREKQGDFTRALKALEEYINVAENHGSKPHWSEERLASLRQKISEAQPRQ